MLFRRTEKLFAPGNAMGWICAMLLCTALGVGVAMVPLSSVSLVTLLAILAALTILMLLYMARKGDAFSVISLITAFYLFAFVVGGSYFASGPKSQQLVLPFHFTESSLRTAIIIALCGWICICTGYFAVPENAIKKWPLIVPRLTPAPTAYALVAILAEIIGWLARLDRIVEGRYFHTTASGGVAVEATTSLIGTASFLPVFAAAIIGSVAYNAAANRRLLLVGFAVALVVEAIWYIPTGDRSSLIGVILVPVIVAYYQRRFSIRLRWLAAAGVAVVVFVIPFGAFYRGVDTNYQTGPHEHLVRAWSQLTRGGPLGMADTGLAQTFSRLSDAGSLATLVNVGRDLYPTENGGSAAWLAESAIPRAVWPGKFDPGTVGNHFGRATGILPYDNNLTSIAVSQPGDMYGSYGILGITVGLLFLGMCYRLIDAACRNRASDPVATAAYAVIAWPLINGLESTPAVGLVGPVKILLLMVAIVWCVRIAMSSITASTSRSVGTSSYAAQRS